MALRFIVIVFVAIIIMGTCDATIAHSVQITSPLEMKHGAIILFQ
jgi:hypothetical protein